MYLPASFHSFKQEAPITSIFPKQGFPSSYKCGRNCQSWVLIYWENRMDLGYLGPTDPRIDINFDWFFLNNIINELTCIFKSERILSYFFDLEFCFLTASPSCSVILSGKGLRPVPPLASLPANVGQAINMFWVLSFLQLVVECAYSSFDFSILAELKMLRYVSFYFCK